ncbi:hypothetical protein FOQG_11956 [Fusarium oxysporum f. sp. raphani 54005]|uniref:Hydrophobin n=2 Tax=Fusarium oxysporum f. sp. raphani TaxID=96318 RepID=X0BNP3_FUSOX|nr:hypothetical protein FOQG_11956 [Fusarium oxysporum f. sp. raphani 54005]KAG7438707.1 hypothetical protein Forpi1262_v001877 [Fusarium oxysporum f. sp. raphani]KAJ4033531.1 hypothetical protein NW763_014405 [Fusarium oxysporum]KAJ4034611.1 hypothetical protein NW753_012494 [Fusarium oxysporum]KAJ4219197.1 hypothetical protein NW760_012534 [Fusarium oxysporum]
MKFTASVLALLAVATGALAAPHHEAKPAPNHNHNNNNNNNNNNNQNNMCGNGQDLHCCSATGKNADVECTSITNGGIGTCNGIQMCCNNNNGKQGCIFNVGGGGTIIIKKTVKNFGW